MPAMPAERELPRALWQATGVASALQGALCCGSLALVTGASPCFLELACFWLPAWKFGFGSFFCCGEGSVVVLVLMAVGGGCLCDHQA